jgi:tripartite-type tricarboxylate transporter receptor subunit TctC
MGRGMRIRQLVAGLFVATMMVVAGSANAQNYPVKPITLIVPWPAGGPTDIVMRAIAEAASKHLGQPIIVDNKAGGGGTVGPAAMAATAKPDGYTIAQMPITVYRLPLMQKVTYNPDTDFTFIAHLTGYVFAAFANTNTPFKTWADVVEYARKNPGKVTYASPGAGTSLHVAMEQIADKEGIKLTHVPFKGAAEVNTAVAGGHTMLGASGLSVKPLVDAGKVRFLNVWTAQRVKSLPDIPTLKELGYPWVFDSPFGIAGPKNMDPKIVAVLHDAFKKALDDPTVTKALDQFEMVVNYKNTEDYRASVKEVTAMEKSLMERLGLLKKDKD